MRIVEVFADVACPFTHVGLRRLVAERSARGLAFGLRVRAWPLEWVNGRPLQPTHVANEVAALRDVMPGCCTGFDRTSFPATSLPAFGLAAAAYEAGIERGEAVSLAVRDELFERGRDVADRRVLRDVASHFGVEVPDAAAAEAAARADYDEGRARGVAGSPHFFAPDGTGVFCPYLDIEPLGDGHVRVSARAGAFDEFLARVAG